MVWASKRAGSGQVARDKRYSDKGKAQGRQFKLESAGVDGFETASSAKFDPLLLLV